MDNDILSKNIGTMVLQISQLQSDNRILACQNNTLYQIIITAYKQGKIDIADMEELKNDPKIIEASRNM